MSAHRATHLLHSTLSIASSSALSHNISRPLKSSLTISAQIFRGFPLFFLPSGTQWNIWLALLSLSLRRTWHTVVQLLVLEYLSGWSQDITVVKFNYMYGSHARGPSVALPKRRIANERLSLVFGRLLKSIVRPCWYSTPGPSIRPTS